MKLARISTEFGPRSGVWIDGEWHELVDQFARDIGTTGTVYPADARTLAPVEPRVVVGMAHNSGQEGRDLPPQAFLKSARTINDPWGDISVDPLLGALRVEGELGVVLRKLARNLTPATVHDHILGYTICNDVTAVDQIAADEKMTQSKSGDGFSPVGPWIETDLDPSALKIEVELGGRSVAVGSTSGLAYGVTEQLVYLTRYMTLGAGDVVMTGAPGTSILAKAGDVVRISIQGIGSLENTIAVICPPNRARS